MRATLDAGCMIVLAIGSIGAGEVMCCDAARASRAASCDAEPDGPKPATTWYAPPESPTTIEATPDVPLLLRKSPSKRPCAVPDDPHPEPEHATVIAPTFDGRDASVDAEKPAPTIGRFDALAVKAGLVQPQPLDTVPVNDAVCAVKFADTVPVMEGAPLAPE